MVGGRLRTGAAAVGPWTAFLALGVTAALALHWRVLEYGFVYDDFGFLRPVTLRELAGTFHGTWDPTGIEVPFYRPLAVLLHKVRFDLLQFDARSCHLLSLVLVGIAGGLVGRWMATVAGAWWVGALGAIVLVAHPAGVWSMTAWITNQMHALQAVVIGVTLNCWWAVRERRAAAWLPLLGLQVVAFLIKEDGIMLLPTLALLHALRPGAPSRHRLPPLPAAVAAACTLVALVWWRSVALGGAGGYGGRVSWERALVTLSAGPLALLHAPVGIGPVSWLAVAAVGGLALASRSERLRRLAFLIASGLGIVLLWNLPFVFVSKGEQYYALAVGASIALAGTMAGSVELLGRGPGVAVASLAAAGWLFAAATDDRLLGRQFSPAHSYVRQTDEIALNWPLSPELRDYLARRIEDARGRRVTPPLEDVVETVTYGMYAEERNAAGEAFRWTDGHATVYVHRRHRELQVAALGWAGADMRSRQVRVMVDGETISDISVATDAWTDIVVPIAPAWFRRFARVELVSRAPWRPRDADPTSQDRRVLGVQIREFVLR